MQWSDIPFVPSSRTLRQFAGLWIAVFGGFSLKYPGGCPFAAFLLFVPLVLSALLGHTVGTLCQKENTAT